MSTQMLEVLDRKVVHAINDCIEACIDGQRGYAVASADARDATLKNVLQAHARERAEFATALKTTMERYGGHPAHHGTTKGKAHRGFMELRVGVEAPTDVVLLGECERGDTEAIAVYDRALAKAPVGTIPEELRSLLVRQRAAIKTASDELTRRDISRRSIPYRGEVHTSAAAQELRQEVDEAIAGLEEIADEVRVKVHLASMDAKDTWAKTLEPRLHRAREHAKEATTASKAAIKDTIDAFREFAKGL